MIEARIKVGLNLDTKVRVGHILDKLFVRIFKSLGISKKIAKI